MYLSEYMCERVCVSVSVYMYALGCIFVCMCVCSCAVKYVCMSEREKLQEYENMPGAFRDTRQTLTGVQGCPPVALTTSGCPSGSAHKHFALLLVLARHSV